MKLSTEKKKMDNLASITRRVSQGCRVFLSLLITISLATCMVPTEASAYACDASTLSIPSASQDTTLGANNPDGSINDYSPSAAKNDVLHSKHSIQQQSMVPMVGTVASGINAAWYAAEGDYVNAGLSAASMIPFAGTAIKGSTLAIKAGGAAFKVSSGLVKSAPKIAPKLFAGSKEAIAGLAGLASRAQGTVSKGLKQLKSKASNTATSNAKKGSKTISGGNSSSIAEKSGSAVSTKPSKNAAQVSKRWQVGDPIDQLTAAGNEPAWSTVRARYWKNEAYYYPELYSEENLARMRKGLAAREKELGTSLELHHELPVRDGGGNNIENLTPLTAWQHDAKDQYRHYTGPVPEGWDPEEWLLANGG